MKNHILRRGSFSRFPYLGKYIAVKGSIVRPLVDVPWNERDEPNFRFDDAKFDGGGGLSSRRIRCRRRMRILRVFAGPIFLETVEQRPKTVADFLLPYPPDNGRFYLQLTESRCFASSGRRRERERELEGEIRGEISSPLWRNMNFYSRPGLRLIYNPRRISAENR